MGVAAILVMWPKPFEQTFIPPSRGVSIWNMSSIGPVVTEEKMFENVDGGMTDTGVTGILLAHQWAFGSGELKIDIYLTLRPNLFGHWRGPRA